MKFRVTLFLLVACLLMVDTVQATHDCPFINEDGTIEEGFVTFATASYFELLRVCLESVHAFSTRPIVVFGINYDVPFSQKEFPRMIKRRIHIDPLTCYTIFTQKPRIMLDSNIKYGVYIEADHIANEDVDMLFSWAHKVKEYPLCPYHPKDPDNQGPQMRAMGVSVKTMPYVHAHPVFAPSCREFLEEWYDMCVKYGRHARGYDETIINVLYWKHKATDYIPLYAPNFMLVDSYCKGSLKEDFGDSTILGPCMFHGCKDVQPAEELLRKLIEHSKQNS